MIQVHSIQRTKNNHYTFYFQFPRVCYFSSILHILQNISQSAVIANLETIEAGIKKVAKYKSPMFLLWLISSEKAIKVINILTTVCQRIPNF